MQTFKPVQTVQAQHVARLLAGQRFEIHRHTLAPRTDALDATLQLAQRVRVGARKMRQIGLVVETA